MLRAAVRHLNLSFIIHTSYVFLECCHYNCKCIITRHECPESLPKYWEILLFDLCIASVCSSVYFCLIFPWMTPLGVNYLCCVAVLALGFPKEKAFLDRLLHQYRERFCRCTSGWRKTIKASHRMPLPHDIDLSSIRMLQFSCQGVMLTLTRPVDQLLQILHIHKYWWNLLVMCFFTRIWSRKHHHLID